MHAGNEHGDQIELQIYEMLHSVDERWESNKYIESEKYSKHNCKLFCHIDFFKKMMKKRL